MRILTSRCSPGASSRVHASAYTIAISPKWVVCTKPYPGHVTKILDSIYRGQGQKWRWTQTVAIDTTAWMHPSAVWSPSESFIFYSHWLLKFGSSMITFHRIYPLGVGLTFTTEPDSTEYSQSLTWVSHCGVWCITDDWPWGGTDSDWVTESVRHPLSHSLSLSGRARSTTHRVS